MKIYAAVKETLNSFPLTLTDLVFVTCLACLVHVAGLTIVNILMTWIAGDQTLVEVIIAQWQFFVDLFKRIY